MLRPVSAESWPMRRVVAGVGEGTTRLDILECALGQVPAIARAALATVAVKAWRRDGVHQPGSFDPAR